MAEGDAEEAKNPQDRSEAEPSTPEAKPKKKAPKAKAGSENANPEKKEGAAESQKKAEAPAAKPEQAEEGGQKESATEGEAKEKKPKPKKAEPEGEPQGGAGEAEKKPKKTKPEGEQKKETQEAGAPHKKGLFSKLSEKLKRHAPADAEKKPAEKKEEEKKAKQQEDTAEKKESLFRRIFKKKPQEEETQISLAPTIVSSNTQVQAEVRTRRQEKLVTPTVAPVPQETFLKKLKHLFGKEPLLPLEIPTHCAVCGIDLHTVYSYTCSNCRKVSCYYCVRSFSEKTYCTKCLKDKGIL